MKMKTTDAELMFYGLIVIALMALIIYSIFEHLKECDEEKKEKEAKEPEERRRSEWQAYRALVESATRDLPTFRQQAEIIDDNKHRDPRSVI
jgi:hypothetical protein